MYNTFPDYSSIFRYLIMNLHNQVKRIKQYEEDFIKEYQAFFGDNYETMPQEPNSDPLYGSDEEILDILYPFRNHKETTTRFIQVK